MNKDNLPVWIALLIIAIVVILSALAFTSCKEGDIPFTMSEWDREARAALNNAGIPDTHTNFKYDYTTPGGIKIRSTQPVPQNWLQMADQGLQSEIDRVIPHAPGYAAGRNLSEYTLLFVDPNYLFDYNTHETTPPCVTEVDYPGSSCLFINGIKSVGTIIGHDENWEELDKRPAIILAHQAANNWTRSDFFTVSIQNEGSHLLLWLNRRNEPTGMFYRFMNTPDCPNCDVHPIVFWAEAPGLVGQPKWTEAVK